MSSHTRLSSPSAARARTALLLASLVALASCSDGGEDGASDSSLIGAPAAPQAGAPAPPNAPAAQPPGADQGDMPATQPATGDGQAGLPMNTLPDPMAAPDAGSTDASDASTTPDAGTTPAPEPVACPTPALSSAVSEHRISIGGQSRDYILQLPTGYTGETPLPLVVDLHPLLTSASFQQGNSGYRELGNREGFIVAWPDGIDGAWDIGPCCVDAADEDFVRALVEEVSAAACVDPKRIYATGFSMGGGMSHYLACNAADVFAAVAPAAFDLIEEMPCQPARPISVRMYRGTADFIVPYRGGPSTPPNGYPAMITFLGAEGTFEKWAELNGCTGTPVSDGGCQTYDSCDAGVEVTLCTTTGGGHSTGDAEGGWAMFERQAMP